MFKPQRANPGHSGDRGSRSGSHVGVHSADPGAYVDPDAHVDPGAYAYDAATNRNSDSRPYCHASANSYS